MDSVSEDVLRVVFFMKVVHLRIFTAQKMNFSIKDFFSECDYIRRKLRIWQQLLKKSLRESFIFCAVLADGSCL